MSVWNRTVLQTETKFNKNRLKLMKMSQKDGSFTVWSYKHCSWKTWAKTSQSAHTWWKTDENSIKINKNSIKCSFLSQKMRQKDKTGRKVEKLEQIGTKTDENGVKMSEILNSNGTKLLIQMTESLGDVMSWWRFVDLSSCDFGEMRVELSREAESGKAIEIHQSWSGRGDLSRSVCCPVGRWRRWWSGWREVESQRVYLNVPTEVKTPNWRL